MAKTLRETQKEIIVISLPIQSACSQQKVHHSCQRWLDLGAHAKTSVNLFAVQNLILSSRSSHAKEQTEVYTVVRISQAC